MPIELGALNQTNHCSGELSGAQETGINPIIDTNGNRPNLDFQSNCIQWAPERHPETASVPSSA